MVTPPRYGPRGRRTRRWEAIEPNLRKLQYIIRHQAAGDRPNNQELCDTLTVLSPVAVRFVVVRFDIRLGTTRALCQRAGYVSTENPVPHVFPSHLLPPMLELITSPLVAYGGHLGNILMPVVANMPEPESKSFAFDDGQGNLLRLQDTGGCQKRIQIGLRKKQSDTSSRSYRTELEGIQYAIRPHAPCQGQGSKCALTDRRVPPTGFEVADSRTRAVQLGRGSL